MIGIISLITYLLSDMTHAEGTSEETSIKVNTRQNNNFAIVDKTEKGTRMVTFCLFIQRTAQINIEEGCQRSMSRQYELVRNACLKRLFIIALVVAHHIHSLLISQASRIR